MALVPAYGHNDAVPNSHALYVGMPGWRGAPEALEAIHRADVILALGSRLSQASTHWNYSIINPQTKIIQVDIDAQEIGRNYPSKSASSATRKPSRSSCSRRCATGRSGGTREWRAEIARAEGAAQGAAARRSRR